MRMFKEHTDEALYQFIKRVRLERSAWRLKVEKGKSISEIGADYGYSSSNFATAFKKHLNLSPADFRKKSEKGTVICNPPYGQRMLEQQSAQRLYAALGRHLKYADGWKKFIITSEPEFEHYFGCRATKKRKLYNGMIKCDYYMYLGGGRKNRI